MQNAARFCPHLPRERILAACVTHTCYGRGQSTLIAGWIVALHCQSAMETGAKPTPLVGVQDGMLNHNGSCLIVMVLSISFTTSVELHLAVMHNQIMPAAQCRCLAVGRVTWLQLLPASKPSAQAQWLKTCCGSATWAFQAATKLLAPLKFNRSGPPGSTDYIQQTTIPTPYWCYWLGLLLTMLNLDAGSTATCYVSTVSGLYLPDVYPVHYIMHWVHDIVKPPCLHCAD